MRIQQQQIILWLPLFHSIACVKEKYQTMKECVLDIFKGASQVLEYDMTLQGEIRTAQL